MNKQVVIDYEEYVRLEEKANLNQSQISKTANKLFKNWIKEYEKQKERNNNLNNDLNSFTKESYFRIFKIKLMELNSIFGYVKLKDIFNLIEEEIKR